MCGGTPAGPALAMLRQERQKREDCLQYAVRPGLGKQLES